MKKNAYFLLLYFTTSVTFSQSIGIGTTTPDASALLHLESSSKGLLIPSMATSQRIAIVNPAFGLQVYDFNTKSIWMYSTGGWTEIVTKSSNLWLEENFNIYRSTGNVGIGISTPTQRLQVHSSIDNSNYVRITNAVTGNLISDGLSLGSDGLDARVMNHEGGLLSLGTNNNDVMNIAANRRIGIGITNPVAKFQINGLGISSTFNPSIMVADSSATGGGLIKFKQALNSTGVSLGLYSGNSTNAEQYLDVKSDSVLIASFRGNGYVGIRNFGPAYPLDVTGDINTSGLLRMNGNAGTTGQVLTSNGAAPPTWQDAAYANNIRFSFNFTQINAASNSDSLNFNYGTSNYNLNPAVVAAVPGNSARIRINRTGLYRFGGSISNTHLNITPTSNPPWSSISYSIDNKVFGIESAATHAVAALPDDDFSKTFQFNFDVYLVAGQTIKFTRSVITYSGGTHNTSGYVNGYFISE